MCIRQSFYPLTVLPVIFVYSKDLCICAVYKTYLLNEYLISPQVCIDIMEFCGEFISTCTQILFPPTTQIQRTDLCMLTTVTLPYIEHHRPHGQTKDNVDRNFPYNLCVIFFQNDYIY